MYLTGVTNANVRELARTTGRVGLMAQPGNSLHLQIGAFPAWAADNGCYALGPRFDDLEWKRWLEDLPRDRCLFAVAPDVMGDAAATLERSRDPLQWIRARGFRAALVAQDGLEVPPWGTFDVLFVGGTTKWKLSERSYELVRQAIARGVPVHMGRVNSWQRLRAAAHSGCASADGTMLAFSPDTRLAELRSWIDRLERAPFLS